jgi:hypothetical protein
MRKVKMLGYIIIRFFEFQEDCDIFLEIVFSIAQEPDMKSRSPKLRILFSSV